MSVCMAQKHFFGVCTALPQAEIWWTELISSAGGVLCASDSSEVVNSLDERSQVSNGPDEVHCSLQRALGERTDCHVLASLKL